MRAGFPTGTHTCRSSEEAHSLLGEEHVPIMRDERFHKNSDYPLKHLLGFIFCKLQYMTLNL
jgi:hypothetical protein